MTNRHLPEVTPCVLFTWIVPHLKAAEWQITRGRGLEEGDRIYRPDCKAKGKFAQRDKKNFLCYEGHSTNESLVNDVFHNGILTPEQVWMPHELSNIDNLKESAPEVVENAIQVNEAAAQPKPKSQKKKRENEAKESGKKKKKSPRTKETEQSRLWGGVAAENRPEFAGVFEEGESLLEDSNG